MEPRNWKRPGGTISICSPDHIGLLIHKTFNASIPRHHIPTGDWQFEYGALENDPTFGAAALGLDQDDAEDTGRWFHKDTGESIGGPSGEVEFTIVSLNVSQSMLSILGSLQPDPFSPEHKPQPATSHPTIRKLRTKTNSEEEFSVANALADDNSDGEDIFDSLKFEMRDFDDEEGAEDLEETVDVGTQPIHDAFAELGRGTDKLSREVAQEAKMEKKRRKEEKKLRKAQEREGAQLSPMKEAKKKKKDRA
ncbi:hypothetical protein PIIN_02188 [Serendipita indica DSM 11827]|uniref:RPA43 OB domain-containing protein n=1 Tax=Serendipita indica (strain DSM 11827) TaxID=1109443 RepID=G4TAG9_SERID|nr:hypothetical protein PIIN_02188 [Serendipita indica DSM 11827]